MRVLMGAVMAVGCTLGLVGYGTSDRGDLYIHPLKHDIQAFTASNWESKVESNRADNIHVVLYYKKNKEAKTLVQGEMNDLAVMAKGMGVVGAVDCDSSAKLCKDQLVTTFPTVLIYPVYPFPATEWKEKIEKGALMTQISRMIPHANVTILTASNYDDFIAKELTVAKVILTSNKKAAPPVFRALSNKFKEAMRFGFVNAEADPDFVSGQHLGPAPSLRVIREGSATEVYKGKKYDFSSLFAWVNIYAETFAAGGGYAASASNDEKPWKYQSLPEMHQKSHQDICFKQTDRGLCVIYVTDKASLSASERTMVEDLKEQYKSKLDGRGTEFRYMWMSGPREKKFLDTLSITQDKLPTLLVFNPHKRMRYVTLPDGEKASRESSVKLFEKIHGGDARFVVVKGQKLPEFNLEETKKEEL